MPLPVSRDAAVRIHLVLHLPYSRRPFLLLLWSAAAMDFLKSAMASAIAKGPPFPYTFGDKVDVDESIWNLYNGTKRARILR